MIAYIFVSLTPLKAQNVDRLNYDAFQIYKQQPDSATTLLDLAFKLSQEKSDYYRMALTKKIAGRIYSKQRKNTSSYQHNIEALKLFHMADTVDLLNIYSTYREVSIVLNRMMLYSNAANYADSAVQYLGKHMEAHQELAETRGDSTTRRRLLLYQARYRRKADQIQASDKLYFDLMDETENRDWVVYADVKNDLGMAFIEVGDLQGAIRYFKDVTEIEGIQDKQFAHAYHNMGDAEMNLDHFDQAINHYQRSLAINAQLNRPRYVFFNHLKLGEALYQKGRYKRAMQELEAAIDTDQPLASDPDMFVVYRWLAKTGLELGDERHKLWEETHYRMMYDFNDAQKHLIENERMMIFQNDIQIQVAAKRAEIGRQQLLQRNLPWIIALLALSAAGLVYYFKYRVVEIDYAEGVRLGKELMAEEYHGKRGFYKRYLEDDRFNSGGSYATMKQTFADNPSYTNRDLVQQVLNDLSGKKCRVKAPRKQS